MNISPVADITATGTYNGESVTYRALLDNDGMFSMARAATKQAGTRPNNIVNKVQVITIEEAAALLMEKKGTKYAYYIWLYYDKPSKRSRRLFSLKSATIHWKEE